MAYTVSQTQSQILTVLKAYLQALTGFANANVVQGQPNRVAQPKATDYIVFTPFGRLRLATNEVSYSSSTASLLDQKTQTQSTQLTVQVDIYGPQSADWAQVLSTEFRSFDAVDYFQAAGFDEAPLYTSEPRQLPFHDEAGQVQNRWSVDVVLQVNIGVTSPQDFADSLQAGIISVDVEWPPT